MRKEVPNVVVTWASGETVGINDAVKRIKELEGLLREYGRHNLGCSGEFPQHKCKCGWDEISAVFAQSEQAEWVCAACGVSHPGKVCPQFKYTEEE